MEKKVYLDGICEGLQFDSDPNKNRNLADVSRYVLTAGSYFYALYSSWANPNPEETNRDRNLQLNVSCGSETVYIQYQCTADIMGI